MLVRSLTTPPATAAANRSSRLGQVAGHVAAVAVAGDREPVRVGDALGDELVDRLQEVLRVRVAPGAERRRCRTPRRSRRCRAGSAAAPSSRGRRAPGGRGGRRRRRRSTRCAGRRGCRAAAARAGRRRVADQPAVHHGAVGDGELALLAREQARRRRGPRRARSVRTRLPVARSTVTTSPNEVGVSSSTTAATTGDRQARPRPARRRPAPAAASPPSTATAYRWVQPRSRTQNSTVRPSSASCGRAPG